VFLRSKMSGNERSIQVFVRVPPLPCARPERADRPEPQIFLAQFSGPGSTWYWSRWRHLANQDLNPRNTLTVACFDIQARFATTFNFYMGFDNNEGTGQQDLLVVIQHELAHGLGFANFVNVSTGTRPLDLPDVYSQYTLDVTSNQIWNDMTNAQRQALRSTLVTFP
jgi:hypothetical protein